MDTFASAADVIVLFLQPLQTRLIPFPPNQLSLPPRDDSSDKQPYPIPLKVQLVSLSLPNHEQPTLHALSPPSSFVGPTVTLYSVLYGRIH